MCCRFAYVTWYIVLWPCHCSLLVRSPTFSILPSLLAPGIGCGHRVLKYCPRIKPGSKIPIIVLSSSRSSANCSLMPPSFLVSCCLCIHVYMYTCIHIRCVCIQTQKHTFICINTHTTGTHAFQPSLSVVAYSYMYLHQMCVNTHSKTHMYLYKHTYNRYSCLCVHVSASDVSEYTLKKRYTLDTH